MARNGIKINQDSGEKTWLTPPQIIKALGPFDLDPCCPPDMPWRTAEVMYTEEDDGLSQPWFGRVWLNPPYGKEAKPFVERMIAHRTTSDGKGIALIFVRSETRLWQDLIFPNAVAILFIRSRLKFYKKDGSEGGTCTMPSALIAFSKKDARILKHAWLNGSINGYLIVKDVF